MNVEATIYLDGFVGPLIIATESTYFSVTTTAGAYWLARYLSRIMDDIKEREEKRRAYPDDRQA